MAESPDCQQDIGQNFPQPFEEEAEVVAHGGHDSVDMIAKAAFEEVSREMTAGFAMADDGLGRRAPP